MNWKKDFSDAIRGRTVAPFAGLVDRDGLPADLETAEHNALREGSPHAAPQDVQRFDDETARLRSRQAKINQELTALREKLRVAPAADTAKLSSWLTGGERGPRPAATVKAIEEEIETLEADHAGIEAAVGEVLGRKAAFVAKHRARLVRRADERVTEAHKKLLELLDQVAETRQELADQRSAALWSALYPSTEAGQSASAHLVAGGLRAPVEQALGSVRRSRWRGCWVCCAPTPTS